MKKGISIWAFPGGSYEENFKAAKAAGFEGLEVALAESGELSLASSEEELLKIRESAQTCGIALYSVASGLGWDYPLTSDDEAVRDKAKAIIKKQITAARLLGCDTVLVVPGAVGVDFNPGLGVVDYETAYDRALSALRELAPFAEENRVSIGVENVWNKFLLSPLEMRDFIDRVQSPYVGAYLDVGNVLCSGYPEHWARILGSRIKKVHFKDFRRSVGTIDGFCDLLAGDVNYAAVMDALETAGYHGWVTAEISPYAVHNEMMLAHTSMAMDKILRREKSC